MRNRSLHAALTLVPVLAACAGSASAAPAEARRRNVAILVFPGVELLDFAGPGEVFAAARGPGGPAFHVYTVAERAEPLTSQGFLTVVPEHTFGDAPPPDVLVVPGGAVPLGSEPFLRWVREVAAGCEVTLSVCNGALLLASAGLLDGLEATTHHSALESLALLPEVTVRPDRRFVDAGRFVTSGGVSSGIDGALHVVARLAGDEVAAETARYMEYRWEPEAAHAYARRTSEGRTWSPALAVARLAADEGVEAALAAWRSHDAPPDEAALNRMGYRLLSLGRPAGAVRVFELVTARFPESANAWDSLGDGYEALGRAGDALRSARRSLALLDADSSLDADRREAVRASAEAKLRRLDPAAGEGDATAEASWVCPPCPADCHGRVYDAPGPCGTCGMPLVPAGGGAAGGASGG